MDYTITPLQKKDAAKASALDRRWFGDKGISEEDLNEYIEKNPHESLAVFQENTLLGFANYEILDRKMPTDYLGNITYSGKVMFIQQFTTTTNYQKENSEMDKVLLQAIEEKAKELECTEVWEALAINHPYKKENNPQFDAFGFYETQGYFADKNLNLTWQPSSDISIPCYLFKKSISDK